MKKSFVYLIVVLMIASFLCACGMDNRDGVIGASPKPSENVDIIPTTVPDTASSMIPSVDPTASASPDIKSPQVGATDNVKVSPDVSKSGSVK